MGKLQFYRKFFSIDSSEIKEYAWREQLTRTTMKKINFLLPIVIIGIFGVINASEAHRSGCHRWHSCPSDSGSYTCGDLGYPCNYPTYSTTPSYTAPSITLPTYETSTYDSSIPSFTNITSDIVTYINPLEKELNGCKLLAKTLDEVINVNNVYKVTLGRDASCGELTDNVRSKTPHDKLKKSLESSAEGKSYRIQLNILNSSEGKTIRDRSNGKFYLIKNHEKHWTPDQLTMNAHGLIYEDAPVLDGNVVAQISEGPQLKYWEGRYYKTVEAIRIGNKAAIKFLPIRLMEVYK